MRNVQRDEKLVYHEDVQTIEAPADEAEAPAPGGSDQAPLTIENRL